MDFQALADLIRTNPSWESMTDAASVGKDTVTAGDVQYARANP